MKRIVFALLALTVLGKLVAQGMSVGTVGYTFYNDVTKSMDRGSFRLYLDDKTEELSLSFARPWGDGRILVQQDRMSDLRGLLEKYLEWHKLAKEKSVEIKKALPNSPLQSVLSLETPEKAVKVIPEYELEMGFVSRNLHEHWLRLDSEEVSFTGGKFLIEAIFLTHEDVVDFLKLIEPGNIEGMMKSEQEKRAIDELFK